jgi:hypothetical protein
MEYGRLVRVTTKGRGGPNSLFVTYVVAEPDRTKAENIIRLKAACIEDGVEVIGRASEELLKTFDLAPGQFIRADN